MNPTPDRPFAAPWQASAFALAVELHRAGLFTWPEWTQALGAELAGGRADGSDYWERWLTALERLVVARTGVEAAVLAALADRWQAAARATPHGRPIRLEAARGAAVCRGLAPAAH